MSIAAKPVVEAFKPYKAPLEGRRSMLRLDFNENTIGPSPKVMEAIRALDASAYATYPEYDGVTKHFATYAGVPAESVGLFNGVDACIRSIFDTFGGTGDVFLQTVPTFAYYAPCAQLQGMKVESMPLNSDLSYPLEAVTKRVSGGSPPRVVFICNPNNPTGTMLSADQILALADAGPRTLFVVDELYMDFTGVTVLPQSLSRPNLLVLRSLSKAQGIAALRIGFVIGDPRSISRLIRTTGPYDVNMFGVVAAHAALDDAAHTTRFVEAVLGAKDWTVTALRERNFKVHSAGGNYILVWPPAGLGADELEQRLRKVGVLVRSMTGKPLISGSLRVSIGTAAQMQQFIRLVDQILATKAAPKL